MRSILSLLLLSLLCVNVGCGYNAESFSAAMAEAHCKRIYRCCNAEDIKARGQGFQTQEDCVKSSTASWKQMVAKRGEPFDYALAAILVDRTNNDPCSNKATSRAHDRAHFRQLLVSKEYIDFTLVELGGRCGDEKQLCKGLAVCENETCKAKIDTCEPV